MVIVCFVRSIVFTFPFQTFREPGFFNRVAVYELERMQSARPSINNNAPHQTFACDWKSTTLDCTGGLKLVVSGRQYESTVDSEWYSNKELIAATRALDKNIATQHFSAHGGLRIGTHYFASPIAGGAAAILRTRSSCDRCCI